MPVYALVVGKRGPRLKESAAGDAGKQSCKFQTPQQSQSSEFHTSTS